MSTLPRGALLLVFALVAGGLASLVSASAPATAGESGGPTQGNYVALAKPVRVFGQTVTGSAVQNVTALGVGGIPRAGTKGLQIMVSIQNFSHTPEIEVSGRNIDPNPPNSPYGWHAITADYNKGPIMNSFVVPVDDSLATNQIAVWDDRGYSYSWGSTSVYIAIDVVGYYTRNAVGGGFVAVNPTYLFDTRGGTMIPAGGTITKKLTGAVIPANATAVFMDLFASGTTAQGAIIGVPYGTDTNALPLLRLWTNAAGESDLVAVKLGTDGQVTFKNTSTAAVHLTARAEGYITDSPTTGGDWQVGFTAHTDFVEPNHSLDFQIAGSFGGVRIPASGVAAALIQIESRTDGANCLRINPSSTATNPSANFNCGSSLDGNLIDRKSGIVMAPGVGGNISVWNSSTTVHSLVSVVVAGWFAAPTNYATAGGTAGISRAMTSAGPCYALLDPTAYDAMTAGCSDDDGEGASYAKIAPGEAFNRAVSAAPRPGGRVVMSAWHAPDGEIWTWEFAHTLGGPTAKPVRTFRYMKAPLAIGTMPDGAPVGFTHDAQGRFWLVDLNVTSPEQPRWIALDIPAPSLSPVSNLTVITTLTGVQLFGTTAGGDVVTGRYFGQGTSSLGWVSLGATSATGTVGVNYAQSRDRAVVVRHVDNSLWTRTGAGGWTRVNTTWQGETIVPTGAPAAVYDPSTQKIGAMFWSNEGVSRGRLFVVWEATPNSADFSGPVTGISLNTTGIASDVTAWDYRNESPLTRFWASMFLDADGGKQFRPVPVA